jgi:hypothetical protein
LQIDVGFSSGRSEEDIRAQYLPRNASADETVSLLLFCAHRVC